MINALHLIWIIPVAACVAVFAFAVIIADAHNGGKEGDDNDND